MFDGVHPKSFLGDVVPTAVAKTGATRAVSPAVPVDKLPENLRNLSVMQVGVYRVEIEHPSIPPGANKSFGFEVDPTSRDGTTARFNL